MSSVDSIPFLNGVLILLCECNPSRSSRLSCQSFSTGVFLFKWIRSFQHPQDHLSVLLNGVTFIRSKLTLFFPPTHPFSSRTRISLSSIYLMNMKSLHSFSSMFLSGDSHEDSNGASSSSFLVLFFSGGFNSSFGIKHTPFLFAQCLFMPVHLLIFHFSLFNYSGVLKISRRFMFPLCIRSRSFEDVISFKPFNSTVAFSLLNRSTVFLLSGP